MLEKLRNNGTFKPFRIFHNKGLTIFGPTSNGRIARVDHVVSLCKINIALETGHPARQNTNSRKKKGDGNGSLRRRQYWGTSNVILTGHDQSKIYLLRRKIGTSCEVSLLIWFWAAMVIRLYHLELGLWILIDWYNDNERGCFLLLTSLESFYERGIAGESANHHCDLQFQNARV